MFNWRYNVQEHDCEPIQKHMRNTAYSDVAMESWVRMLGETYGKPYYGAGGIHESGEEFMIITRTETWKAPAYIGERLDVKSWITEIGNTSVSVEHEISANGKPIYNAQTKHVHLTRNGENHVPNPISDDIRAKLSVYKKNA